MSVKAELKNEMTAADALAELKRIVKLLVRRNQNIARYSSKKKGDPDEVEHQKEYIKQEHQSADDLITRWLKIKLALNEANLRTMIEFKGKKFSVAEAILFKQHTHDMQKRLLNSFTPNTGNKQISARMEFVGRLTKGLELSDEELAAINLVPELMYSEAAILKEKDDLLNLYSFIDALIEKSNHNTVITI